MGLLSTLPRVVDAFRTGEGVPYAGYGEDTREGVAATSRPMYAQLLGSQWLPALPDVHARLSTPPSAHVADIACGSGWSSINIARAYPLARVDGIDEDAASIDQARRNAAETGMQERVRFMRHDASDPSLTGTYDLVTIFEAVHDMARPVEALRTARGLLAPGGCVLVADEKVHDRFTVGDQDPVERWMYGFSVLHCLPVSRADTPSAATGTVMRTHTMRAYAAAGRLPRRRDRADRARLLALLPPQPVGGRPPTPPTPKSNELTARRHRPRARRPGRLRPRRRVPRSRTTSSASTTCTMISSVSMPCR